LASSSVGARPLVMIPRFGSTYTVIDQNQRSSGSVWQSSYTRPIALPSSQAEQMAVDRELAAVRGLQLGDSLTHGGNRQGTQPCPYAWAIEQSSCTSQQL
jgi:hypothetical protein